jgi:tetratricopeptide (TPR) repeat protein
MTWPWRGLSLRLGLGLLAFSALFFLRPLEDAYILPQRLGLALAALLLLAAPGDLPWGRGLWLGLAWFAWRILCHAAAGWGPDTPAWLGWQGVLLALFLGSARVLRGEAARRGLAGALTAALLVGAAFALLGPLGWDPFAATALDQGFGHRAYGSLGNPDFLGGWLALLLPLALALSLRLAGARRRWALAAALSGAAALWLTQARGAWLAGAAGVAVALLVLRSAWPQALRVAALGLALGAALLLAAGPAAWMGRLRESADWQGASWQGRRMMTGLCLQMALQHPWMGVGPGRFTDAFLAGQAPRLSADRSQPYRYTEDAHDDWAQAAAEGGWPGLALWGALVFGALALAWRRGGVEGAALGGGLAALAVQSCLHFPLSIAPTQALAMAGLGLAAGWDAPAGRPWPRWAALGLALALGVALAQLWRQCLSSACLNRAAVLAQQPEGQAWRAPLLAQAAALRPEDVRAWTRLGRAQLDAARVVDAQASYRRALGCLPHLSEAWAGLSLAEGMAGDLADAEAHGREATALDPRSAEAWSNLAKVVYLRGDHAQAVALARQGLRQAPEGAAAWFNLAAMLYNDGQVKAAVEPLRCALRLQPAYPEAAGLLQRCQHAR